jgi:hypothetical protein
MVFGQENPETAKHIASSKVISSATMQNQGDPCRRITFSDLRITLLII